VDNVNLEDLYYLRRTTPGNIHEHLPTLRAFSRGVVVEIGTNEAVSTTALLAGQPDSLTTWDLNPSPNAEDLRQYAGKTHYDVRQGDSRYIEIGPCDVLFIDSLHTREQLDIELRRHAPRVTESILLHDTETFGERGEDGGQGLLVAVRAFLADCPEWRLVSHWPNCHGLTLLRRSK
jgi:hypothetical protein